MLETPHTTGSYKGTKVNRARTGTFVNRFSSQVTRDLALFSAVFFIAMKEERPRGMGSVLFPGIFPRRALVSHSLCSRIVSEARTQCSDHTHRHSIVTTQSTESVLEQPTKVTNTKGSDG